MAGMVASAAAGQMFGDIQREWSDAVGGFRSRTGQQPQQPAIDWADFNYPPLLRMMHYDLKELPSSVSGVVRFINAAFVMTVVVLLVSIIDSFVLAVGGVSWVRVAYSWLNLFIFAPCAGYVFYQGYRGVALSNQAKINKYLLMQGLLAILAFFFALIPFGCFNGFATFALMKTSQFNDVSGSIKAYWTWSIVSESILWLLIAAVGAWDVYRAKALNPYSSQDARSLAV